MKNKALVMVAIVTVAAALVASATIAPYNHVFAAKRNSGDSNAQTSASNNDCPAVLDSLLAIQQQAFAGCIINGNQVQDSDGTATSQIPFNTGPSQQFDFEIEVEEEVEPQPTPAGMECEDVVGEYRWDITIDEGTADVPEGTIICLFQGLGNHPATVIPPEGEGDPYDARVNTNQPNMMPPCQGMDQQLAHVSSEGEVGGIPVPLQPLEAENPVCAVVGDPIPA